MTGNSFDFQFQTVVQSRYGDDSPGGTVFAEPGRVELIKVWPMSYIEQVDANLNQILPGTAAGV